jgi:tetratricopeptide (TPR) repeat protein
MSDQNSTDGVDLAGDPAAQRRAGHEYLQQGKYLEALECWRRVEAAVTGDVEAARMIGQVAIAQNREDTGLEMPGEGARRLKPRPPKASTTVSSSSAGLQGGGTSAGPSLNPLQQLEAAIRERPSIPDLYLQLAQAYLDKDKDYDAERLLHKGREATDHDPRVQEMWEDVSMMRHARRIEITRDELKTADTPQNRQALEQVLKDRDKLELDIFRGRVKRQGAGASAHYGLGIRLQRADRLRDATTHLEKALEDPDMRSPAALALGQCMRQLEDLPAALRHFRLAARAAIWEDQRPIQVEALQQIAKLMADMKLEKLQQRYLSELARIQ